MRTFLPIMYELMLVIYYIILLIILGKIAVEFVYYLFH